MTQRRQPKTKRDQIRRETEQFVDTRMNAKRIEPMTINQRKTFDSYHNDKHLMLVGSAGTGKTYISLYLALKDVLSKSEYKEVIIIRSSVQSREQGFMPGSAQEKMAYFEAPYVDIVNDLFERGDAYSILKQKKNIRFMSTSFIRGLTFDNAIILVDEAQNLRFDELRTVMTRLGDNSRIIFCGDTKQDDLNCSKNRLDVSGLRQFKRILDNMKKDTFETIEFNVNDIVRSGIVKEFIIAEEMLEVA